MNHKIKGLGSQKLLLQAIRNESYNYQKIYLWLEDAMPSVFFEEITDAQMVLIVHSLMGFDMQDYDSTINLKTMSIALGLDTLDADVKILKNFALYGINNYQVFVSNKNLPFEGCLHRLRVTLVHFIEEEDSVCSLAQKKQLLEALEDAGDRYIKQAVETALSRIPARFLQALPFQRQVFSLKAYIRALDSDLCQYEVQELTDWKEQGVSSGQVVIAWRNTPKAYFLLTLAQIVYRHGLVIRRAHATYVDPYSQNHVLVMVLSLHGANGKSVTDACDMQEFMQELTRSKYFATNDSVYQKLLEPSYISGNQANLLRAICPLLHQFLLPIDPNLYTLERIEQAFCRHVEYTQMWLGLFAARFDPKHHCQVSYQTQKNALASLLASLDTGNERLDQLSRVVFEQAMHLLDMILKTNYYRTNLSALCFRIDPDIFGLLPYDPTPLFPARPFGIFFVRGMNFSGFHVRFQDLSRGGLRTVVTRNQESYLAERDRTFQECYHLAWTQHKKNKDIPEGGSKGVLFLRPFHRLGNELEILRQELELYGYSKQNIDKELSQAKTNLEKEYVEAAQRSYVEALLSIVNCHDDGTLKVKHVIDYYQKPEYLYLGPDENMSNEVIEWIAWYSQECAYKIGSALISSKPKAGLNHKSYGVTSLGVRVYMEAMLQYVGINPHKTPFKVKLSGGPDGDVAGNMIYNLYKHTPKTAQIVALTDVSGTIEDLSGLCLETLVDLFHQGLPISHYPTHLLHNGAFVLNRTQVRSVTAYSQQMLLSKKVGDRVLEEWITISQANALFRQNLHQVVADVFITAGGRPQTLHQGNWQSFLLPDQHTPSAKIIVEGANLYLTKEARDALEEKGVLIVKDHSANKTGVMCSSFEVLCGLTLGDALFQTHKRDLVRQILKRLKISAEQEAKLLLKTHELTGRPLTQLSEEISEKINNFTDQILASYAGGGEELTQVLHAYALPLLREKYPQELDTLPQGHQIAIFASYIASQAVYHKGLDWSPSIVDILPLLIQSVMH